MDIRVISLFKHQLKIRDHAGDAQDLMLTEIGKRLSAIAINILHLEPPDEEQLNELLNILATHFSDFSADEFATAFEYRVIGKLKNFGADLEHFNKFSPEYVSNVCTAFRRLRVSEMKAWDKNEQLKKESEIQKASPQTKEGKLQEAKASWETLDNFIRINKKLPLGWNWDQVYFWIKFGLKEIKMSDADVAIFRSGVVQVMKAEWLDKRRRERRKKSEEVSSPDFEPTEAEIVGAMKSTFVRNYFTKKHNLDVQQEILFNSEGPEAGQGSGAGGKKTDPDSSIQKNND